MYEGFYGLTDEPFKITPDPRFLYLSPTHEGGLKHLLYGVERKKGFIVLTGGIGTGKTTLLNTLVQKFDTKAHVAFLKNPHIAPIDIYKYIFHYFSMDNKIALKTEGDTLIELESFLINASHNKKTCLLILDEAQNASKEILEQLRLLSNFETHEEKLLQIILSGNQELQEKLNALESVQLQQRISISYTLFPLNYDETQFYIGKRLAIAGASRPLFTEEALEEIYRCSRGIPRLINVVCDLALLLGYNGQKHRIGRKEILQAEEWRTFKGGEEPRSGSAEPPYLEAATAQSLSATPGDQAPAQDVPSRPPQPLYEEVLERVLSDSYHLTHPPRQSRPAAVDASPGTFLVSGQAPRRRASTEASAGRRHLWSLAAVGSAAVIAGGLFFGGELGPIQEGLQRAIARVPFWPLATQPPMSLPPPILPSTDQERAMPPAMATHLPTAPALAMPTVTTETVSGEAFHGKPVTGLPVSALRRSSQPTVAKSPPEPTVQADTPRPNQEDVYSPPPPAANSQAQPPQYKVVIVQSGDTLQGIMLQEYKRFDPRLLAVVQTANPDLTNPAYIVVGQQIVLPKLPH